MVDIDDYDLVAGFVDSVADPVLASACSPEAFERCA